jgi:hypothetical protein
MTAPRNGWTGALTRRIEAFYAENPGEWLTWEDLCIKFDCTKNQATGALQSLRADGRLAWEIVAVVRIKALET